MRGGLALHKPVGISSFDVIRKLRSLMPKGTKLGHAGTLDPAAQGLLLVLVNEATRVQHLLKSHDKEYIAEIRLGIATDTLDAEGKIVTRVEVPGFSEGDVRSALSGLMGKRMQRPPRFSALKVNGRRAYDMARSGEEFELKEREVEIFEIEILSWQNPILRVRTRVSAGTYIRSLAEETGEALGVPASLGGLVRTRIGNLELKDALELDNVSEESIRESMISMERLLEHIPHADVDARTALMLLQGKPLNEGIEGRLLEAPSSILYSLDHTKAFLCEPRQGMLWSRRLLFADEEPNG